MQQEMSAMISKAQIYEVHPIWATSSVVASFIMNRESNGVLQEVLQWGITLEEENGEGRLFVQGQNQHRFECIHSYLYQVTYANDWNIRPTTKEGVNSRKVARDKTESGLRKSACSTRFLLVREPQKFIYCLLIFRSSVPRSRHDSSQCCLVRDMQQQLLTL